MEEALRCPLLWLEPLLELLVPLVVSLGARTLARASPGAPRSPPSCRGRQDAGFQSKSLGGLWLAPLHPTHRAPPDLSLPAQQEVGGGYFIILLASQGFLDFFPCVAHPHHHIWERGGEKGGESLQAFPCLHFGITEQHLLMVLLG